MPITGHGWELLVTRLGLQSHGGVTRTYATYQAHRDGVMIPALFGHLCECTGPGDNTEEDNGMRIEAGRYQLSTQFGQRYRSMGFSTDTHVAGALPMPGLLLKDTENRTAILIHPGHPPHLYLSSVGCLNLTKPLGKNDDMEFFESRKRVIAMIDNLRAFSPGSFQNGHMKRIPDAFVVIDGEPMTAHPDVAPPTGPALVS
jgi:hypothetical protein